MRIFSFQPISVLDKINKDGFYHPFGVYEQDFFIEEKQYGNWGFQESYKWLRNEMLKLKKKSYKNNEYLIWGWQKWNGKNKPDKRYKMVYEFYDKPFVMLELEIKEDRILLSDYDAWHYVLNYWYLEKTRRSEQFVKKFDFYKEKPLLNSAGDEEIKKSWSKIFEINEARKILKIKKKEQFIQACFFDILKEDIVNVTFFDNKK